MTDENQVIKQELIKLFQQFSPTNCWHLITDEHDFQCSKFSTGAIGQVIHCRMDQKFIENYAKNCDPYNDVITEIVAKRVPQDCVMRYNPLELSVINALICQNGLGPRLIYTDKHSYVYEYIPGTNYTLEHDLDPEMVRKLARLLARFHGLRVPVSNDGFQTWSECIEDISKFPIGWVLTEKPYLELIKNDFYLYEKYWPIVSQINQVEFYQKLIRWNRKVVCNSSLVFCHNDFNRHNRKVSPSKRIYMLDLDFANYNFRGQDLGRYFSNYQHQDDMFGDEGFPLDHEMDLFLEEYRQEFAKTLENKHQAEEYLNSEDNSLEQLKKETKIFTLNAYGIDVNFGLWKFTTLYRLNQNEDAENYLKIAVTRWKAMQKLINRFIVQESIVDK